jgi:hypothetical protein
MTYRVDGDGPSLGQMVVPLGDAFVIANLAEFDPALGTRRSTPARSLKPGARVYDEAGKLLYTQPQDSPPTPLPTAGGQPAKS